MSNQILGHTTQELLRVPLEDVALELAKIAFVSKNMPSHGLSGFEAAYNMTCVPKDSSDRLARLGYYYGAAAGDIRWYRESGFLETAGLPDDYTLSAGYEKFLDQPWNTRDEASAMRRNLTDLAKLQGLFGLGFIDSDRKVSAAHVAARLFLGADIDNPVARHLYEVEDGLSEATDVPDEATRLDDWDKYGITRDWEQFADRSDLLDAAQHGVEPADLAAKAFFRQWFLSLRTDLDKLQKPKRVHVKQREKERSLFGYGEDEILSLDFTDIVRAVAKYDYALSIATPFHTGMSTGIVHSLSGSSRDGYNKRSNMYDQAVMDVFKGMCNGQDVPSSIWYYVRLAHGKKMSGIDWRRWQSVKASTVPKGQPRFLAAWEDVSVDIARRADWTGLDGMTTMDHAAALHYRRADIHSSIDRGLHAKTDGTTTIEMAVKRVLDQVKPRQAVYAYKDYKGTELKRFETDAYVFLDGEVGTRAPGYKDDPERQVENAENEDMVRKLGYAGMQGVDMLFAELRQDFARIDAAQL